MLPLRPGFRFQRQDGDLILGVQLLDGGINAGTGWRVAGTCGHLGDSEVLSITGAGSCYAQDLSM